MDEFYSELQPLVDQALNQAIVVIKVIGTKYMDKNSQEIDERSVFFSAIWRQMAGAHNIKPQAEEIIEEKQAGQERAPTILERMSGLDPSLKIINPRY